MINLQNGRVPVTEDFLMTKIKPHKAVFRNLADKRISLDKKRKFISNKRGFKAVSVVLPTLLDILASSNGMLEGGKIY